jgi:predicted helicase
MTGDGKTAAIVAARSGTKETGLRQVTKESIFQYAYAVLYDPKYRETYALNLRREFPRIPFYPGFWQWSDWGKELMALHVGYENIDPWPLQRAEAPAKERAGGMAPKVLLKTSKDKTVIYVDSDTSLTGVPAEAWDYKLGNRSALDWVLDQHKEKKPKDPLVAATFDTYRFVNVKEEVIALIGRVARLSVETVRVTEKMRAAQQ